MNGSRGIHYLVLGQVGLGGCRAYIGLSSVHAQLQHVHNTRYYDSPYLIKASTYFSKTMFDGKTGYYLFVGLEKSRWFGHEIGLRSLGLDQRWQCKMQSSIKKFPVKGLKQRQEFICLRPRTPYPPPPPYTLYTFIQVYLQTYSGGGQS